MTRNTPNSSRLVSLLVFALCFLVLPITCSSSVLAIDYGTDSFKASLIKPGVPFDVLLTKEGKRKIQSLVTIRGQGGKERFVGSDAQNLVSLSHC
jgi:hypoxia up-regulated 1